MNEIILYADDDPDDKEFLKEAFARMGIDVELVTCGNGAEAISLLQSLALQKTSPCLIILDINMPVLGGKETLANLRNLDQHSKIPVVLFSTSSQPLDKEFATKHNAGFVTKPLHLQEMVQIAYTFIDYCTDEVKKSIRRPIK